MVPAKEKQGVMDTQAMERDDQQQQMTQLEAILMAIVSEAAAGGGVCKREPMSPRKWVMTNGYLEPGCCLAAGLHASRSMATICAASLSQVDHPNIVHTLKVMCATDAPPEVRERFS